MKQIKTTKAFNKLPKGARVLVTAEPEIVEIRKDWNGTHNILDGAGTYVNGNTPDDIETERKSGFRFYVLDKDENA